MTEVKEWVRMKPQKTAELTRKLKGIELSDDDTATDQISKFFSDMIEARLTQTETADLLFQVSVKIADFKAKQMRNRGLQLNQQHYHRLRQEEYDQLKAIYDNLCKQSQSTETNTTQHHPTPPSEEEHFTDEESDLSEEEKRRKRAAAKRKAIIKFAEKLVQEHQIKTIPGKNHDTIYRYDQGKYISGCEPILKAQIEREIPKLASNHVVAEILGHVKRMTYGEPKDPHEALVPVINGVLDLRTLEINPHTPDNFFKFQIPARYDDKADCPEIKKLFEQILNPEDILVLQEFFGFCLYRRYFLKKALICVGDKDTGKTTTLTLLNQLIGEENVASLSIQRITTDRFSAGSLKGKLANIYDELPYADLANAGAFKTATGGGYIPAEEKFGDCYQFVNHAKFIYACNQIPSIKDTTDMAYFDRWLVLWFRIVIPKNEQDPFLMDKLTTPDELSGLLKWAVEGFQRLYKNRKFSYSLTAEQNRDVMMSSSEPLKQFVDDCVIQAEGENSFETKDKMYNLYKYHAMRNNLPIMTKTKLTQQIPRFIPSITVGQRRVNGKTREVYNNVKCQDYQDFLKKHEKELQNKEKDNKLRSFYVSSEKPLKPLTSSDSKKWGDFPVANHKCCARGCEDRDDTRFYTDGMPLCKKHWKLEGGGL